MAAYVDGFASLQAPESIAEHLADCPECRKTVAKVTASQKAVRSPAKRQRR